MLNGLDLFSGYGGIARALRPWVRIVAYCENDRYRQSALLSEMQRGHLDRSPIWDDIRTLRSSYIQVPIDIVLGGWPCTGHSVAGSRTGLAHVESALAGELIRCIREFRPRFAFLENVPGVLGTGMDSIVSDLAKNGYVGRYGPLSCPDVGEAWHAIERIWIAIADSCCLGGHQGWTKPESIGGRADPRDAVLHGSPWFVTDADRSRLEGWLEPKEAWPALPFVTAAPGAAWPEGIPEPTLLGKDDGPTEWIGQIETVGGGVVPQVAREAFQRLMGLK